VKTEKKIPERSRSVLGRFYCITQLTKTFIILNNILSSTGVKHLCQLCLHSFMPRWITEGLELNGTHQLLAYDDDVNMLGGSVHTVKENAEALVMATKEIGLEINADKTKYMVMYLDQDAGRSLSMKSDNSSFERVEGFRYLGTTLTNQNSIQEEIKSRWNSWNSCYHLVQNLLSSSLLSKNTKL